MSINGVGSNLNSTIYQSLLKQLRQADSTSASASAASSSSEDTSSSQQLDAKTLLSRLAASQPTLSDYLSGIDNSSSGSTTSEDSSSLIEDVLSFDPNTTAINAFLNDDSNSDTDSTSADPFNSLLSSSSLSLNSSSLSSLLEKLYSESDEGSQSTASSGQMIDIQK